MNETFKPFQRVLIRENETEEWSCDLYSHYDSVLKLHCVMGAFCSQCIPYEGNEHLVGTTNEPKSERWRAEMNAKYYFVNGSGNVIAYLEADTVTDNMRYNIGNYFRTKEEAQVMADKFKALLKEE